MTWSEVGRANLILDNLIADGVAEPMLVVMPKGHPVPWSRGRRGLRSAHTEAFREDLQQGVIPFVETHCRMHRDRRQRAIAGLSMGGGQALFCMAASLDDFAWVGAFSAATPSADENPAMEVFLADPEHANQRLALLWIATGRDDFPLQRNTGFKARLGAAGIAHTYLLTDGGHSWPVWRDYLARLVPLLFRAPAKE